jgi:hypothetical protein
MTSVPSGISSNAHSGIGTLFKRTTPIAKTPEPAVTDTSQETAERLGRRLRKSRMRDSAGE